MASKGTLSNLPPPPQEIPPNVVPMQVERGKGCGSLSERLRPNINQMNGPRPGVKGKKILLLTNHFRVCFQGGTSHLYSYSVSSFYLGLISTWKFAELKYGSFNLWKVNVHYENGDPVTRRNLIRKVIHKLWEIYSSEFGEQTFATDGQQSLFTACPLPKKKLEFTVVLDVATSKR